MNDTPIDDPDNPPLLSIAMLLSSMKQNLSPLGLQTIAWSLLVHIARAAEAAPDPVHGGSVIDHIAETAKGYYRTKEPEQ
jgi:hypothetical protein